LRDESERHTLDETLSSKDSDLPVDPERSFEDELLDEVLFKAPPQKGHEGHTERRAPNVGTHPERGKARTKSVAFMGSQGGVGVSLIVANLGVALARLGLKVALADFNPSGLNLHTYLGIEPVISTPSDLLRRSPDPLVERVPLEEPGYPERHLWLCRPATALLTSTPIEHRMRAFQALKKIDADIVLMDLGHDADQFSLERYREATKSVTIFRPNTVSIERGHVQLRAALFSALIAQGDDASIVARALLMADHVGQLNTPSALLQALERVNPQAAILMRERLASFQPLILLNQCKTNTDRDLTLDLCAILQRKWRIGAAPLGAIDHDESAHQEVRQRVSAPMLLTHSGCSICSDLERFAKRIAREILKVEPA
jgi:flagellar biosynthesis protein FlhG